MMSPESVTSSMPPNNDCGEEKGWSGDNEREQDGKEVRYFKSNRVLDEHVKRRLELNDKTGIKMHKTYELLQIEAGGHDKLPYLKMDCRNYLDKQQRLRLVEGDAEAMHRYFMKMKANNSNFFYALDLDDKGRLRNVFWVDARSRATCKEFGDVVTFDTTYLVNKHDMPFAHFVGVNYHGQSTLLGCGLIPKEDTKSFSVHQKVLGSNTWLEGLYSKRKRWVSAYLKDVFWAGMSSTQRSEEESQDKYDMVMTRVRDLKQELMEAAVMVESNVVLLGDGLSIQENDSFSLGDGVIPSKRSTNILDPEGRQRKGPIAFANVAVL
ncbi:far-red elongated hypocotyls 3 [Actinidia rufa]|uniref:Far-red elongated hypocotyls 3 n=1 Tax=Actinidia rufa TaxID=165716 RepID=A0A7J0GEF0_9ERIC|nr:far-red elongated hypocotyls 3 [Actinidia rufa]